MQAFIERYKEINCLELIGSEWKKAQAAQIFKFFLKGGPIRCFRMAGNSALISFREINAAYSAAPVDAPVGPVSCASLFIRKLGLSDLYQSMAAGFAGGIGLCGGACGVLGAAVWALALRAEQRGERLGAGDSRGSDLIDRFVESADYEFECAKITGRRFATPAEHAEFLRAGGCARIIDSLAAFENLSARPE